MRNTRAYKYAKWCVEEQEGKVPKYVKMQAEQWLAIADGKVDGIEVDMKRVEKLKKLLGIMVHPDLHCSMYDGLEDYAHLFITATLCTVQDGKRYYETGLLEISRKNFKTFTSAVIFILLLLMEPNFSRFFSVAPDLALSSELYVAIKKIIKSSPLLYDEAEPVFKILRKEIICKLNDNDYVPLAYSNDGLDGKLANCFLADECGALDDYPVEAMRSSQITLPEKLGIIISTQYPNDNNVFLTEIDIAKKTLDGVLKDTKYFSLLYEPDDDLKTGDRWMTDDRCIFQSNPVSVHMQSVLDNLKAKRQLAVLYENKRENYLCKHNNIQYKGLGTEGYIDVQKVKLCSADLPKEWWRGRRVWLGLDLAQTDDNTAVAMLTEDYGEIYGKVWGFIPGSEEKIKRKSEKEHIDYRTCIKDGECFACGDEVVDYGFIEQFIMNLPKEYGVEIVQAGYDRYNAISTVQKLEGAGIECVEVKQHSSVLHAPTKLLKESILNRLFHYDKNRLYEINYSNARCTYDTNMSIYLSKKRSSGKIDLCMATLDALYCLQQEILFGHEEVIMY